VMSWEALAMKQSLFCFPFMNCKAIELGNATTPPGQGRQSSHEHPSTRILVLKSAS
jgi:hypothetical protein